jgi:hypothetical protein
MSIRNSQTAKELITGQIQVINIGTICGPCGERVNYGLPIF